jgi:predicted AAA+ superfamily ATPase
MTLDSLVNINKFDIDHTYHRSILIIGPKNSGKSTISKHFITQLANITSIVLDHQTNSNIISTIIMNKQTNPHKLVLVMDEFTFPHMFEDSTMLDLYNNYRHYNISTIITFQSSFNIPPTVRHDSDIIILCADSNITNQHKLYDQVSYV